MIWITIAKPFFRLSKSEVVNSDIYINKCLGQRLLPYIYELKRLTIPKEINPPNVFQERPIENYWVCLAQKVYEGGWEAKTEQQLIRCIECKLKEFDTNFAENLFEGINIKGKSQIYNV